MGAGSAARLSVRLADGRSVETPLSWYPTLVDAPARSRLDWELIGGGRGVSWPALDVDLSVQGMLSGVPEMTLRARRTLPADALVHALAASHASGGTTNGSGGGGSVARVVAALATRMTVGELSRVRDAINKVLDTPKRAPEHRASRQAARTRRTEL
jgi:hypothetical protein